MRQLLYSLRAVMDLLHSNHKEIFNGVPGGCEAAAVLAAGSDGFAAQWSQRTVQWCLTQGGVRLLLSSLRAVMALLHSNDTTLDLRIERQVGGWVMRLLPGN